MKTYKYKIEVESDDPDSEAYVEGAARDLIQAFEFGPHQGHTTLVKASAAKGIFYLGGVGQ